MNCMRAMKAMKAVKAMRFRGMVGLLLLRVQAGLGFRVVGLGLCLALVQRHVWSDDSPLV